MYIESSESVAIYSHDEERNVFHGTYNEAYFSEYADEEICSFGIEDGIICINI